MVLRAGGVYIPGRRPPFFLFGGSMPQFPLTRRAAVGGLAAATAAPTWASVPSPLNFLAVGDWGRDGAFGQRDVAARMGRVALAKRARFVVSVGDNFYDDGVQGVDDPKWRTSFETIYDAPSLQVPWY